MASAAVAFGSAESWGPGAFLIFSDSLDALGRIDTGRLHALALAFEMRETESSRQKYH